MIGGIILLVFAVTLIGGVLILDRRYNPLFKMERCQEPDARLRFEPCGHVQIGSSSYSNTLAVAFDDEYVYLRHSLLLPNGWLGKTRRVPRRCFKVNRDGRVQLTLGGERLDADFGDDFVRRFKGR